MRLEHPVFQGPLKVDINWREIDTPAHYVGDTSPTHPTPIGPKLKVSDIETERNQAPAPIVINFGFLDDIPGLEFISDGLSSVNAGSVAIGRQGRFMYWAFPWAPDKMNEWGRNLLVNSVYYMYSKRNSLTIPFHTEARQMIVGYREQGQRYHNNLATYPSLTTQEKAFRQAIPTLLVPALQKDWQPTYEYTDTWFKENLDYVYAPVPTKKIAFLDVDQDAKRLKTPNYKLSSLQKWIELVGTKGEHSTLAKNCLDRYVDESIKPANNDWKAWWKKMKDRVVFVDTVGYKFIENPTILEKEGRRPFGMYM